MLCGVGGHFPLCFSCSLVGLPSSFPSIPWQSRPGDFLHVSQTLLSTHFLANSCSDSTQPCKFFHLTSYFLPVFPNYPLNPTPPRTLCLTAVMPPPPAALNSQKTPSLSFLLLLLICSEITVGNRFLEHIYQVRAYGYCVNFFCHVFRSS